MRTDTIQFFELLSRNKIIGYNLKFSVPPSEAVLSVLESAKFKYSKINDTWYTTNKDVAVLTAQKIGAPELVLLNQKEQNKWDAFDFSCDEDCAWIDTTDPLSELMNKENKFDDKLYNSLRGVIPVFESKTHSDEYDFNRINKIKEYAVRDCVKEINTDQKGNVIFEPFFEKIISLFKKLKKSLKDKKYISNKNVLFLKTSLLDQLTDDEIAMFIKVRFMYLNLLNGFVEISNDPKLSIYEIAKENNKMSFVYACDGWSMIFHSMHCVFDVFWGNWVSKRPLFSSVHKNSSALFLFENLINFFRKNHKERFDTLRLFKGHKERVIDESNFKNKDYINYSFLPSDQYAFLLLSLLSLIKSDKEHIYNMSPMYLSDIVSLLKAERHYSISNTFSLQHNRDKNILTQETKRIEHILNLDDIAADIKYATNIIKHKNTVGEKEAYSTIVEPQKMKAEVNSEKINSVNDNKTSSIHLPSTEHRKLYDMPELVDYTDKIALTEEPISVEPKPKNQETYKSDKNLIENRPNSNYFTEKDIPKRSALQRLKDNFLALKTLIDLQDGIIELNGEEQEKLAKFSGWGGISEAKNIYSYRKSGSQIEQSDFSNYYEKISELARALKRSDYDLHKAISTSTLNAFYTGTPIIKAIWYAVQKLGFKGGNVLEPSAGIGSFFAYMPKELQSGCRLFAVEKELITGKILQYLYPKAENIHVGGYETAPNMDNYFDLVISNIPFGNYSVFDTYIDRFGNEAERASMSKIQDFFFAKAIRQAKDGGIIAFITSMGTMNASNSRGLRRYFSENTNFLGAIRLPSGSFSDVANTNVSADVIFLQKRGVNTDKLDNPDINDIAYIDVPSKKDNELYKSVKTNQYFIDNNDMIIGDMFAGGLYSENDLSVLLSEETLENSEHTLVENYVAENIIKICNNKFASVIDRSQNTSINEKNYDFRTDKKPGAFFIEDGKVLVLTEYRVKECVKLPKNAKNRNFVELVQDYLELQKAYFELVKNDADELSGDNRVLREQLNKSYKNFTDKHGILHSRKNTFLLKDIYAPTVFSLEVNKDNNGHYEKAAIFYEKINKKAKLQAKTLAEAIGVSLNKYGYISEALVSVLLDTPAPDIIWEPYAYWWEGKLVPAFKFLSGNITEKLIVAKSIAQTNKKYEEYVLALEAVLPKKLEAQEITISMGATWVPIEYYSEFIAQKVSKYELSISLIEKDGVYYYKIAAKNRDRFTKWAAFTKNKELIRNDLDVIEAAMNDSSTLIRDEAGTPPKMVINEEKTTAYTLAVERMKDTWKMWVFEDETRRELLVDMYNEMFNNIVPPIINGDFLTFPTAQLGNKTLYSYQKNGIAKIIINQGGLVDHQVGAGKTIIGIASTAEMKRMGLIRKPVIVVLKKTLPQIVAKTRQMYPLSKILAPTEKDFEQRNRQKLMAAIAGNDWDFVILSHEQFGYIPLDIDVASERIEEELFKLDDEITALKDSGVKINPQLLRGLKIRKENLEAKLAQLIRKKKDSGNFSIKELGIDYIVIDESHYFKNIPYTTRHSYVAGLGASHGSKRAFDLLIHVETIRKYYYNGQDKGLCFMTGTPISNSIVEMFGLMSYMIPTILRQKKIDLFDKWAKQFAEKSSSIEFDTTANLKLKTRFRIFYNLDELSALYAMFADVQHNMPELVAKRPGMRGGNAILIKTPISCEQKAAMNKILSELQTSKEPAKGLIATNKAQKVSIDMRLIDRGARRDLLNKVCVCARMVASIYYQTVKGRGTQIIFCDYGTPQNADFSVYDDLKKQLVSMAIPPQEIQFIHDFNSDLQSQKLYSDINNGNVRILIASTRKGGTGVNIQKRLVAIHNLDLPWTPALFEQRTGRGIRQGNLFHEANPKFTVPVFVYATEQTLDAYKFELLGLKQKFIEQVKNNYKGLRRIDEGDISTDEGGESASVGYATFVAQVSGNPYVQTKAKLEKQINDLEAKRNNLQSMRWGAQKENNKRRIEIAGLKKRLEAIERFKYILKEGTEIQKSTSNDGHNEYKFLSKYFLKGKEYTSAEFANIYLEALKKGINVINTDRYAIVIKEPDGAFDIEILGNDYHVISIILGEASKYIILSAKEKRAYSDNDVSVLAANMTRAINYVLNSTEKIKRDIEIIESLLTVNEYEFQEQNVLDSLIAQLSETVSLMEKEAGKTTDQSAANNCRPVITDTKLVPNVVSNPKAIYDFGELPELREHLPTRTSTAEKETNTYANATEKTSNLPNNRSDNATVGQTNNQAQTANNNTKLRIEVLIRGLELIAQTAEKDLKNRLIALIKGLKLTFLHKNNENI